MNSNTEMIYKTKFKRRVACDQTNVLVVFSSASTENTGWYLFLLICFSDRFHIWVSFLRLICICGGDFPTSPDNHRRRNDWEHFWASNELDFLSRSPSLLLFFSRTRDKIHLNCLTFHWVSIDPNTGHRHPIVHAACLYCLTLSRPLVFTSMLFCIWDKHRIESTERMFSFQDETFARTKSFSLKDQCLSLSLSVGRALVNGKVQSCFALMTIENIRSTPWSDSVKRVSHWNEPAMQCWSRLRTMHSHAMLIDVSNEPTARMSTSTKGTDLL